MGYVEKCSKQQLLPAWNTNMSRIASATEHAWECCKTDHQNSYLNSFGWNSIIHWLSFFQLFSKKSNNFIMFKYVKYDGRKSVAACSGWWKPLCSHAANSTAFIMSPPTLDSAILIGLLHIWMLNHIFCYNKNTCRIKKNKALRDRETKFKRNKAKVEEQSFFY